MPHRVYFQILSRVETFAALVAYVILRSYHVIIEDVLSELDAVSHNFSAKFARFPVLFDVNVVPVLHQVILANENLSALADPVFSLVYVDFFEVMLAE